MQFFGLRPEAPSRLLVLVPGLPITSTGIFELLGMRAHSVSTQSILDGFRLRREAPPPRSRSPGLVMARGCAQGIPAPSAFHPRSRCPSGREFIRRVLVFIWSSLSKAGDGRGFPQPQPRPSRRPPARSLGEGLPPAPASRLEAMETLLQSAHGSCSVSQQSGSRRWAEKPETLPAA